MRYRISDIGEQGLAIEESLGIDRLKEVFSGEFPSPFEPVGPTELSGELRRIGLDVLIHGSCTFRAQCECASCLKQFELDVSVSFRLSLKPRPAASGEPTPDRELRPEDLDEAHFSGDHLELDEILREQIILALPMYPRCSEACRGLCPVCGADRNTSECECERGEMDPRWAALKALKMR